MYAIIRPVGGGRQRLAVLHGFGPTLWQFPMSDSLWSATMAIELGVRGVNG